MRCALAGIALAACTDSTVTLTPVIDVPLNDTASAFPLDQLFVEVAHDGDALDLASAKFTKGQTPQVSGVPFADDIVVHLTGFVGTSEVAYGRSCAVAVAADSRVPQPHLYFSRSVKFGQIATQTLPELRIGGVAITYHDGSGLLLGGADPGTGIAVGDVERFDPRSGVLELLAHACSGPESGCMKPRVGAIAAPLGVGGDTQIAVIGGLDPTTSAGAQFLELVEADQPDTRRVQSFIDINMSRVGLTATTLSDGRVIVVGGRPPPNGMAAGDVDEITTDNGAAVVRMLPATLSHPRYGHTATRLGDDVGAPVLIAGGLDDTGAPVADAELYKPLAESFSMFTATMKVPRTRHQAVRMPDGSVLIIGGVIDNNQPPTKTPVLELFTLVDGKFTQLMQQLPPNAGLTDFTATTLPDGRVLIAGGLDANNQPTAAAFIARLDPLNGVVDVVPTDQMSVPRAGHQATLLCDGTVLISGGTSGEVPPERYNPPPDGRR